MTDNVRQVPDNRHTPKQGAPETKGGGAHPVLGGLIERAEKFSRENGDQTVDIGTEDEGVEICLPCAECRCASCQWRCGCAEAGHPRASEEDREIIDAILDPAGDA